MTRPRRDGAYSYLRYGPFQGVAYGWQCADCGERQNGISNRPDAELRHRQHKTWDCTARGNKE